VQVFRRVRVFQSLISVYYFVLYSFDHCVVGQITAFDYPEHILGL
jgi:hypothetical protein